MSIEYQLYSMSITNQIIIPVVGNRQSFHQQNVFVHTPLALTPRKEPNSPQPLLWKKTSSAFKKFKDKKDRKQHLQSPEAQNIENLPPPTPTRFYVLTKKTSLATSSFKQLQDSSRNIAPFGYFDPNEAPLYKSLFSQSECCEMKEQYLEILRERRSKSSLKIDEQMAECRAIKIEPLFQRMQEEGYMQQVPVVRDDDPFIIIRKYGRQKGIKATKTKTIRKQRLPIPKQPILTYQKQSLKSIIMANKVSEKSLSGSQLSLKLPQDIPPSKSGFTAPDAIKDIRKPQLNHTYPYIQQRNDRDGLAIQNQYSPEYHESSANGSEGSWGSSERLKGVECD